MPCTHAQHYVSDYEHGLAQLSWAFDRLSLSVTSPRLEQWAAAIVQSLSGPGRYFHGPEHSFNLAAQVRRVDPYGDDGLAVLAALFHDTVYTHVDAGLPPAIAAVLDPLLQWEDGSFSLKFPLQGQSHPFHQVASLVSFLFDLPNQTTFRAAEHNEYLSALWAAQLMAPVLSRGQIAEIAVAIEATIPFRGMDRVASQSETRYHRLCEANHRFNLALSEAQIHEAIHRSVHLTNCDLESFAAENPILFLDQTWLLLPEQNPALRSPQTYRAQDYRLAVQQMETFMLSLKAQHIFQQFRAFPNASVHGIWTQRAYHNLDVARLYLSAKVVAIGLIEALCQDEPFDRPLVQILGHIYGSSTWEQQFPVWPVRQSLHSPLELKVLQVAEEGRITPCSFDSLRSPLTAFLIRSIGFKRVHELRARMQRFFEGEIDADTLLRGCEAKVIQLTSQILQPFP